MGQHYNHLSAEERGAIMVGKARGDSARQLAMLLGRSPSTISRELRRNGHHEASDSPRLGDRRSAMTPGAPVIGPDAWPTRRAGRASCIVRVPCGAWCATCWAAAGHRKR